VITSKAQGLFINRSAVLNVARSTLDAASSEDENIAALGKLQSKKAPGSVGIAAERVKSAINDLPILIFQSHKQF
jgi:hypothetical protein